MIDAHETFGGTWPFAPHFFDGAGFRQHYVDEAEGEPIICLHGEPTWGGYEFPIDAYLGRIVDYVIAGAEGVPALAEKPAILLEGMADHAIFPERAIADFRGVWPHAPVVELPGVGHFCQEDAPEMLVANIRQFLQATP